MTQGMKRVVLQKDGRLLNVLLCENRALELICCDPEEDTRLNRIYIGKVKNIVQNIRAAFVEIGEDEILFLPMDDIGEHTLFTAKTGKKELCAGDELAVQIIREPIKTKPACLTTRLSLSGRYAAVCRDCKHTVGVSKKLTDRAFIQEQKRQLGDLLSGENADCSIILRTNAYEASPEEIREECRMLLSQMNRLCADAPYRMAYTRLYCPAPAWMLEVRDTRSSQLTEIVAGDETLYQELLSFLPEESDKLRLHDDRFQGCFQAYSLEKQIREALSERVWLRSGAYLVIQPTEALTVIDVNSGKAVGKKAVEETFFRINQEAAKEAAHQIRLRNLSGIILIDFINLKSQEHVDALLAQLEQYLMQDRIKTSLIGMSRLGLVEITRQKQRKPIYETEIRKFLDS